MAHAADDDSTAESARVYVLDFAASAEQVQGACGLLLLTLELRLYPCVPQAAAVYYHLHHDSLSSLGFNCATPRLVHSRLPCAHPTPSMLLSIPMRSAPPASLDTTGVRLTVVCTCMLGKKHVCGL